MRSDNWLKRLHRPVLVAIASTWLWPSAAGGGAQRPALMIALPAQGSVYMLAGPLTNSALHVGPDGALLVDTQVSDVSEALAQSVSQLSSGPLRFIVNTSSGDNQAGGNERLRLQASDTLAVAGREPAAAGLPGIIAHENVRARMIDAKAAGGRWPTETFAGSSRQMHFNGEPITLVHHSGISDGDSLVVFGNSRVIATGEVFSPRRYPRIDLAAGGSIDGVISSLDTILTIAASTASRAETTVILPGRGPLSDSADVAAYRDAMTAIRDRIRDMAEQGMSLSAIKQARPTARFDPIYATQAHPGETFTETVFRSLTAQSLR